MKAYMLVGVVSEILLVSGIILVFYGVGTGLSHPMELCGLNCLWYIGDIMPYFPIGIVLLVASSVGFLFSLRALRRVDRTQGETHL